jgi:hypothetical protein
VHLSIQQSNVGELCYKIDILSKLSGADGAQKRPITILHDSFSEPVGGRTCVHMEVIFGCARVK